jgi:hypothetical protein
MAMKRLIKSKELRLATQTANEKGGEQGQICHALVI